MISRLNIELVIAGDSTYPSWVIAPLHPALHRKRVRDFIIIIFTIGNIQKKKKIRFFFLFINEDGIIAYIDHIVSYYIVVNI